MAWAFVKGSGAFTSSAGTTRALAFGSNVAAGNRLIAVCVWTSNTATCSVADSQGNSWAAVGASLATAGTTARAQVFHASAGSSAACTVTMTTSVSTGERVIFICEVSGLSGSLGASPLAASGTSANPTANITIGATSSLLIGGCYTGGTAAVGSGFTQIAAAQDGNVGEYRIPAGTGAQPVSFMQAGSALYAITGVEFLAAGAAATPRVLASTGVGT